MRLLVTGAAGFIGSNFVRMIASGKIQGIYSVAVLDKLTYAGVKANLLTAQNISNYSFNEGDICSPELVASILKDVDAIINFAAESHVDRSISGSAEFIRTNVLGTHSMLQASLNANIKQFLHVSTDEVYGSISEGSWDEQEPLLPNSPYAASKASSDLIARSFFVTHGLDVRITRCSNNFGIYQFPEKVIPLFITNLMEGKKVPLYGDGLNVRDWLHVDDHCRGIQLVIDKGRAGQIYNIGGGTELSNIDLTNMIIAAMGATPASIEPVEDRKAHDRRYSVDITKIHNELGYAPQCTLHDTLHDIVDWYKNNEQWWKPLKSQ